MEILKPVFLCGNSNSGNSMTAAELIKLPGFSGLPLMEAPDQYGQYHHLDMQDIPDLPEELKHRFGPKTARLWAIGEFLGALTVTEKNYSPLLARRTKRALGQFAQRDKRLVLSSPANLMRIRLLLQIFPDAMFITLIRNPFTVVEGIMRKRWCDPQRPWISGMTTTVEQAAEQWENANILLLSAQQFLKNRLMIVYYEDLVDETKTTFNEILDFLGVSKEEIETPRFKQGLNPEQISRLTTNECTIIERICWPMMDHHGYQRSEPHI